MTYLHHASFGIGVLGVLVICAPTRQRTGGETVESLPGATSTARGPIFRRMNSNDY
jgi:hypothetical protein